MKFSTIGIAALGTFAVAGFAGALIAGILPHSALGEGMKIIFHKINGMDFIYDALIGVAGFFGFRRLNKKITNNNPESQVEELRGRDHRLLVSYQYPCQKDSCKYCKLKIPLSPNPIADQPYHIFSPIEAERSFSWVPQIGRVEPKSTKRWIF